MIFELLGPEECAQTLTLYLVCTEEGERAAAQVANGRVAHLHCTSSWRPIVDNQRCRVKRVWTGLSRDHPMFCLLASYDYNERRIIEIEFAESALKSRDALFTWWFVFCLTHCHGDASSDHETRGETHHLTETESHRSVQVSSWRAVHFEGGGGGGWLAQVTKPGQ